jgi:hypothetical protein
MIKLKTNGRGWWSSAERTVIIKDIKLAYIDDDFEAGKSPRHGELRIVFDPKSWDVNEHGLIYSDQQFMRELREFLESQDLAGGDVTYSEQGMQGGNYVSCDVGAKFLRSWGKKFSTNWDTEIRKQEQAFNPSIKTLTP